MCGCDDRQIEYISLSSDAVFRRVIFLFLPQTVAISFFIHLPAKADLSQTGIQHMLYRKKIIIPLLLVAVAALVITAGLKTQWFTDFRRLSVSEKKLAEIEAFSPESFMVSPDNRRLAYASKLGEGICVTVDGVKGKSYETIVPGSLVFSPDSKRHAYGAVTADKSVVVVLDGRQGEAYEEIGESAPVFSPDSRRFAFAARKGTPSGSLLSTALPVWVTTISGK
jgi:hypothetical protein